MYSLLVISCWPVSPQNQLIDGFHKKRGFWDVCGCRVVYHPGVVTNLYFDVHPPIMQCIDMLYLSWLNDSLTLT